MAPFLTVIQQIWTLSGPTEWKSKKTSRILPYSGLPRSRHRDKDSSTNFFERWIQDSLMKSREMRRGSEGNQRRVCRHASYQQEQWEFHSNGEFHWGQFGIFATVTLLHFHSWARELKYVPQPRSLIGWGLLGWCWEAPDQLQATERAPAARKTLGRRDASTGVGPGCMETVVIPGQDPGSICFRFAVGISTDVSRRLQN